MTEALVVLLIIAALLFIWLIAIYNKLIRMIEAVVNNEKQIDVQLDRRQKVFESLISVVKKYMDYEKTTLKEVIALRGQAQTAAASGDQQARMAAENEISKIAGNFNLVFEQYPELKADKSAMQLQEEIVNTENKLTFAKQAFNDSIETYNYTSKSFFEAIVVGIFSSKLNRHFTYWALSDDARSQQEDYRVEL